MLSDHLPVRSAADLFAEFKIDPEFHQLQQLVGLSPEYFEQLYLPALNNYAESVQCVPASEAHHHARMGGLLEHTVDMVHIALKLRKGYKLPIGGTAEEIAKNGVRWTYAVFVAALLHDIGKLITDFRIVANILTCITKRQREQYAWLAPCLTGGAMSPISER